MALAGMVDDCQITEPQLIPFVDRLWLPWDYGLPVDVRLIHTSIIFDVYLVTVRSQSRMLARNTGLISTVWLNVNFGKDATFVVLPTNHHIRFTGWDHNGLIRALHHQPPSNVAGRGGDAGVGNSTGSGGTSDCAAGSTDGAS